MSCDLRVIFMQDVPDEDEEEIDGDSAREQNWIAISLLPCFKHSSGVKGSRRKLYSVAWLPILNGRVTMALRGNRMIFPFWAVAP